MTGAFAIGGSMVWRCCIECGQIYSGGINCQAPRCIGVGEPLPDAEAGVTLTGGVGITKLPPWDVNTPTKK